MKKYKAVRRKRSHLCPDKDCKRVWTNYSKEEFNDGYSHSCYGVLKKKYCLVAKKAKHDNEASHCIYTPFKGMIHYFATLNDLFLENLGTLFLMDKLNPAGKCCKCKQKIRRYMASSITDNKKKKWCYDCYRKK